MDNLEQQGIVIMDEQTQVVTFANRVAQMLEVQLNVGFTKKIGGGSDANCPADEIG